jgi:hypothetical protein
MLGTPSYDSYPPCHVFFPLGICLSNDFCLFEHYMSWVWRFHQGVNVNPWLPVVPSACRLGVVLHIILIHGLATLLYRRKALVKLSLLQHVPGGHRPRPTRRRICVSHSELRVSIPCASFIRYPILIPGTSLASSIS